MGVGRPACDGELGEPCEDSLDSYKREVMSFYSQNHLPGSSLQSLLPPRFSPCVSGMSVAPAGAGSARPDPAESHPPRARVNAPSETKDFFTIFRNFWTGYQSRKAYEDLLDDDPVSVSVSVCRSAQLGSWTLDAELC